MFGAEFVELRPVSGHTAGNAVMMGLCKPGDTVLELSRECGGHRLASKLVTSELIPLHVAYHAFDDASFNLDVKGTIEQVAHLKPRLLFVGSSNFLFPIPLKELADELKSYPNTVLVYDASHVLGLIVGKWCNLLEQWCFDGADINGGVPSVTVEPPLGTVARLGLGPRGNACVGKGICGFCRAKCPRFGKGAPQ
jgi:glycine hydroxymethyltransferase